MYGRETDLEGLAFLELSGRRAVECQGEHVPDGQLDHATCWSSCRTGIAHQQDAEVAHFARRTRRLRGSLRERCTKSWGTNGVAIPATRAQVLVLALQFPAWRVLVRGARASRLQSCWRNVTPYWGQRRTRSRQALIRYTPAYPLHAV